MGESAKPSTIALNKKARFQFELHTRFEAGLVLKGWEVKSLRQNRITLVDSYVVIKQGEAFLIGTQIAPLPAAGSQDWVDPERTRKLLLKKQELSKLTGAISRKGFSCVCTAIYWKNGRVKCEIALARGKAKADRRETIKRRDWEREKNRVLNKNVNTKI